MAGVCRLPLVSGDRRRRGEPYRQRLPPSQSVFTHGGHYRSHARAGAFARRAAPRAVVLSVGSRQSSDGRSALQRRRRLRLAEAHLGDAEKHRSPPGSRRAGQPWSRRAPVSGRGAVAVLARRSTRRHHRPDAFHGTVPHSTRRIGIHLPALPRNLRRACSGDGNAGRSHRIGRSSAPFAGLDPDDGRRSRAPGGRFNRTGSLLPRRGSVCAGAHRRDPFAGRSSGVDRGDIRSTPGICEGKLTRGLLEQQRSLYAKLFENHT